VASVGDAREMALAAGLAPAPRAVVLTDGGHGGTWRTQDGAEHRWAPTPLPGPPVDSFGAGDTFAAAITHALAHGAPLEDAIGFAARCGAAVVTGRGPYGAALPAL
jgi:ribokinase